MELISNEDPAWFRNRQRKVAFDEAEVRAFVEQAGRDLARNREFAVLIASDNAVRQANSQFRGLRSSTDVLSFPDGEQGRLGDIMISAAQARRQAREIGHRVEDEIKTLVLHGLLHLLGFDHETDDGQMRRAEARWRRKYGLQCGLIERVES